MLELRPLAPLLSAALAASLALSAGCRRDTDNGGADPDAAVGAQNSIYEVQDPAMPVGTPVTLRDVVVTAVDTFGGRTGGLYVQEPAGGPYSGILVFFTGNQAAGFQPGDIVDVVGGVKEEFSLETGECERTSDCTLTQIVAPQGGSIALTKVGQGQVPEPVVLLPQDLAADDEEAEKWESVLIKFEDVRVHRRPRNVSMSDETLKEMTVTGPFLVSSSLTALSDDIQREDCYAEVVGIGEYFFNYKILPRSAADLVVAGTDTCIPPETGDEACMDGLDNDFNGFTDCDDFGCATANVACPTPGATVVEIQDGTIPEDAVVRLVDVVVTARAFNGTSVWVQDATGPGPHNGLQLFNGSGAVNAFPDNVDVGAQMTVEGRVTEFDFMNDSDNSVTQLVDLTVVSVTPDAATPGIVTEVPLATLITEPYEGVLVHLENVKVTSKDGNRFTISDGASSVVVDDTIFRFTSATVDQCLRSIAGVMHYNSFGLNIVVLLPRAGDIDDTPGTCD